MSEMVQDIPDGWVREDIIAGMDTIGLSDHLGEFLGMGGGYRCDTCSHYIPIESLDEDVCPTCKSGGMIGTVLTGRQEVTALYPEGWFEDE